MATYYIDYNSNNSGRGLTEASPAADVSSVPVKSGDTVLIRCGSFFRGKLETVENVYYGTYGEGEKPVFCGSVNADDPDLWKDCGNNIWRLMKRTNGGIGNFVFDKGKECGTYRWEKEDLKSQGDFFDSRPAEDAFSSSLSPDEYELLVYSKTNPADYYKSIEAVCFGQRKLADAKNGVTFEGLKFINSGVHGIQGQAENVTIKNCDFEFIGGCPWNKKLKIRFGNAIEFFDLANDITVENCYFYGVYDSCITYQGYGEKTPECDRFICRNNVFDTYGMAAFEYRDKLPMFSVFENNICRNAGCGFAMQGETLPRKSEIWPLPMGHHIFIWRIKDCRYENGLKIYNNRFENAPNGAAVYSVADEKAEKGAELKNNLYAADKMLMTARLGCKDYEDFEVFRNEREPSAEKTV